MNNKHLLKIKPQYAKLLLAFFLTVFSSHTLYAYELEVDGIYYEVNEDETSVTVTSCDRRYSGDAVIPSTIKDGSSKTFDVTAIGDRAFQNCSSITSISIPEGVTSIGLWAFRFCTSLTSISIPNSVTSIGNVAFGYCYSLTSIFIPEGVTSIGYNTFNSCASLTYITVAANNPVYDSREGCNAIIETSSNTLIRGCRNTIIPEGVTSIEDWAFTGCPYITSISIPESVTSIGSGAFDNCSSLTSISIPKNITSIENWTFEFCPSLTSISIPEKVTSIGGYAFYECSSLTSISIPEGVKSIGEEAFRFCALTSVICYAETVPELGDRVFWDVPTSEATLYVPASAIEDYKAAEQWKDFGTILPLEDIPAGIDNIKADDTTSPYYTLDGKQVDTPTHKGIYIKDGKKILIK